ncbi:MAG TPA: glycosyltransferase family 39 protein [Roseiflexaceae bacterium]|nr:glycosyltransferase family 39 protein [Roseiflexaceae bacterium]
MAFISRFAGRLIDSIEGRAFIWICVVVAALVRLVYVFAIPTVGDVIDSRWYYEAAVSLAAGQGLVVNGRVTAFWPVGYPAFLAVLFKLFGASLLAAKLANVALYLVAMGCAYGVARRIFRSQLVARLTLLLLAIYPNHIAYSAEVLSEVLSLALLMAGCFSLVASAERPRLLYLSGIVFGFATLVKPQIVLLTAFFLLCLYLAQLRRGELRAVAARVAAFYVLLLLVIAPWTIRNYLVFGHVFLVSNNSGLNFFYSSSPSVRVEFGSPLPSPEISLLYESIARENEYLADRAVMQRAIEDVKAQPTAALRRMLQQAWYLWYMDVDGGRLNERNILDIDPQTKRFLYGFKIVSQAYYLTLLALAALGVAVLIRRCPFGRYPLVYLGLGTVGYFTVVALFFHGETRYHFPIMPLVVMYSAFALELLLSLAVSRGAVPLLNTPAAAGQST